MNRIFAYKHGDYIYKKLHFCYPCIVEEEEEEEEEEGGGGGGRGGAGGGRIRRNDVLNVNRISACKHGDYIYKKLHFCYLCIVSKEEEEGGGGEEEEEEELLPGKREPDSSLSRDCEGGRADKSSGRLLSFSCVPCQTEVWPAFRLLL